MIRKLAAEFIGTFAMVFCGTGAIVIDQQNGGQIGTIGIAITFGLIVMVMIYSYGSISGAHFNPAVSFGFYVAGLFPLRSMIFYSVIQASAALAASTAVFLIFPGNEMLGSTQPSGSAMQSFVMEIILAFLLMTVILNTAHGAKETGLMAGIAIGATVGLEAMFAGPISGASMNPARSLAPAIVSGHMENLWIYLVAPVIGALLASLVWQSSKMEHGSKGLNG